MIRPGRAKLLQSPVCAVKKGFWRDDGRKILCIEELHFYNDKKENSAPSLLVYLYICVVIGRSLSSLLRSVLGRTEKLKKRGETEGGGRILKK